MVRPRRFALRAPRGDVSRRFSCAGVPFDDYAASALFLYFGLKTLKDAYDLPADSDNEELEDAEKAVENLNSEQEDSSTWGLTLQTFSLVAFWAFLGSLLIPLNQRWPLPALG